MRELRASRDRMAIGAAYAGPAGHGLCGASGARPIRRSHPRRPQCVPAAAWGLGLRASPRMRTPSRRPAARRRESRFSHLIRSRHGDPAGIGGDRTDPRLNKIRKAKHRFRKMPGCLLLARPIRGVRARADYDIRRTGTPVFRATSCRVGRCRRRVRDGCRPNRGIVRGCRHRSGKRGRFCLA